MSRIGRKTIPLPAGVKVVSAGREVRAEGPKGKLSISLTDGIDVTVNDGNGGQEILVTRVGDERRLRAMHGTTRALIAGLPCRRAGPNTPPSHPRASSPPRRGACGVERRPSDPS